MPTEDARVQSFKDTEERAARMLRKLRGHLVTLRKEKASLDTTSALNESYRRMIAETECAIINGHDLPAELGAPPLPGEKQSTPQRTQ